MTSRDVGAFRVHALVDVAGPIDTTLHEAFPDATAGAVGGRPGPRPDDLRIGRRLGAPVPRVRRGRTRRPRHDRRPRGRHRDAVLLRRGRRGPAGSRKAWPRSASRPRTWAPSCSRTSTRTMSAGCSAPPGSRCSPTPTTSSRRLRSRRLPATERSSRRPSTPCGSRACCERSTVPTRSGRASTSSRRPATRPGTSRSGCPRVATSCCSRATCSSTPCSCCSRRSPTPPRTTRPPPRPPVSGCTPRHGVAAPRWRRRTSREPFVDLP